MEPATKPPIALLDINAGGVDAAPLSRLRLAMAANATFSGASGVVLTLDPARVASWLGVSAAGWLSLFGVALLGHALVLSFVLRRHNVVTFARANLAAIAPYPLLMIGVVVASIVDRPLGIALVLLDGLAIALIAIAHVSGLRIAVS